MQRNECNSMYVMFTMYCRDVLSGCTQVHPTFPFTTSDALPLGTTDFVDLAPCLRLCTSVRIMWSLPKRNTVDFLLWANLDMLLADWPIG